MIDREEVEKHSQKRKVHRECVYLISKWIAADHRSLIVVEGHGYRSIHRFLNPCFREISSKLTQNRIIDWNTALERDMEAFLIRFRFFLHVPTAEPTNVWWPMRP